MSPGPVANGPGAVVRRVGRGTEVGRAAAPVVEMIGRESRHRWRRNLPTAWAGARASGGGT